MHDSNSVSEACTTKSLPTSSSGLSLRRNFSWTAFGNVIYAACQWGIIAALTKIGSAEMVGMFAFGLAITAPIQMFSQMQLRGIQATDAHNEFVFAEYLTLRTLTTIIALIVSVAVVVFGDYEATLAAVIALIALAKAIDSIIDVFYGAFQQRERMDIVARVTIAKGLLSLVFMVTGIWLTGNLLVGVVGYVAGSLLPLVMFVVPVTARLLGGDQAGRRWNAWAPERMPALFRMSFPLGVVMLLVSLNSNVPRYVIEDQIGTAELGIFAAIAYLIVAGNTIVGALGQSASPRLAKLFASGRTREFRELIWKLMIGGLTLGCVGALLSILVGREILAVIYTRNYADHAGLLTLLSLVAGVTFAASFAGYGLTATRTFDLQVPIFAVTLAASVIFSTILIPKYGLTGAALSMGATSIVQAVFAISVVHRTTSGNTGVVDGK